MTHKSGTSLILNNNTQLTFLRILKETIFNTINYRSFYLQIQFFGEHLNEILKFSNDRIRVYGSRRIHNLKAKDFVRETLRPVTIIYKSNVIDYK